MAKKKEFKIGKVYWLPYRGPIKVSHVGDDSYGGVYLEGVIMRTSPDGGKASILKVRENTSSCIEVDPRKMLADYNKVFAKAYFPKLKKKKVKSKPRKNAKRKTKTRKRR